MEALITVEEGEGSSYLRQEGDALNRMLNQADEFVDKSIEIDQEFDFQNKRLEQTGDKLNEILGKVPIFNALFRSISFHRYKESLVLGLVVGLVMFFGLKLIFFK